MDARWRTALEDQGARWEGACIPDFGNPAGELEAVDAGSTVVTPLDDRGLLTATGTEVLSFLQGQLTNDVHPAEHGTPVLAAHLSPKGRVLAGMLVFAFEDGYALEFPNDVFDPLTKRLRMFVLRSDVTLHDARADWIRLGLSGAGAEQAGLAAVGAGQAVPDRVTRGETGTLVPLPGPIPAFLALVSPEHAPDALEAARAHARPVGRPAWELARIRAGVPDLGTAVSESFIPQEANLEPLGGISYTKGCYTGQEVVARTKHLGRLKRRLYRVAGQGGLEAGRAVYARGQDQAQGRIVQAAPRPGGGQEALAVLRIETVAAGADLYAEGAEDGLEVLTLPYAAAEDAG
ncbi:MAG: YgfZ/GcvT domain-containing protein [Thiohalorhabdus sp.]|uniref:CAF17-like 4Fe-4S cluster assembly/insertion protein YgfZ n=1 Tax=Thiohalorhabdus sp. TaxID=3094134 RepID=UPI0039818324